MATARRQSREQARLRNFRMLQPGEVDSEIARDELVLAPVPPWDTLTVRRCETLYDAYVRPANGSSLPDAAFCDLPKWVFLEYLVTFCGALLSGSNSRNRACLEPIVLSRNVHQWNRPRIHAFANSTEALFLAILDHRRLFELDCPNRSTAVLDCADGSGNSAKHVSPVVRGFYFGLDYRALPYAPWRPGAVYIYDRADFPPDFATTPLLPETPIRPMARVNVQPRDWPLLDRVRGVNIPAQTERQRETFRGYPWIEDADIHPHYGQRPVADAVRTYLDTSYAEPADLSRLGQRFGVSPFALLRLFRAHVGLSPREYQMLRRIGRAKDLLRAGLSIARVAVETGFCDQAHLTRHFREIVGATPGQYLRMQESPISRL